MASLDEIFSRNEKLSAPSNKTSTVKGKFLRGLREKVKGVFTPKDTFSIQEQAYNKQILPEKRGSLGTSPTSMRKGLESIFTIQNKPYEVRRAFEKEPIQTRLPPIIGKSGEFGFRLLEAIPKGITTVRGELKAGGKPMEVETNIDLRRLGFEGPKYKTAALEIQDAVNKGENPWVAGLRVASEKTLDVAFGASLLKDIAKLTEGILLKGGIQARLEASQMLNNAKTISEAEAVAKARAKEVFERVKNAPLKDREEAMAAITNTNNLALDVLRREGMPAKSLIDKIKLSSSRYLNLISRETPFGSDYGKRFLKPDLGLDTTIQQSINSVSKSLPGYRERPGQAPPMGLSIRDIEPVGFVDKKLINKLSGEEFQILEQGANNSKIKSLKTGEVLNIKNEDLLIKFSTEVKSLVDTQTKLPGKRTEQPMSETGQVGRDLEAEIKENVERYNQDKLSDNDIRKIRESNLLGKESIREIILRKRGVITDKQALEMAKDDTRTIEDIINIPKGSTATKEQLTAVSQIIQTEREINLKLRELINGGGMGQSKEERQLLQELNIDLGKLSDHEILNRALAESTLKLRQAEIVMLGLRAETGRALQGMKQIINSVDSRMKVIFDRIKNLQPVEQQAVIEQIADIKIENDKEFIEFLDKITKADFFEKFAEYSTAVKLWNPTTHVVNLGGNILRQIVDFGLTSVVNPMVVRADVAGALHGLGIGLRNAMKALTDEGYARELSKYIEEGGRSAALGGNFGKLVRTPFRLLGASDEIFKSIAFQRSLYRQAYSMSKKKGLSGDALNKKMEEILNAPTFEMTDKAVEEAKKMTFQEDLGEITQRIENWRHPASFQSKGGKLVGLVFRFFVPFLKTPINLLKQSIDFSPIGLTKNFSTLKKAAGKGDKEKVGKIVGEALLGSLIMTWVVSKVLDGKITGGVPKEKKDADEFYREKKLPYSVKIGDTWYQYKRVDPFATVMGTTADLTHLSKEDDVKVSSFFTTIMNQMSDKTYLQGISDLITLLEGEDWEKENVFKNMLLGATLPSIIGHTARTIDPTVRDTRNIVENIKAQIPGLSQTLPERVNVLGEDIERANKGFNFFFNPIQSIDAEIDPVTTELLRLDHQISIPSRSFTRNKIKYELTGEQYADFSKFVGTKIKDEVLTLISSKAYKNLSEEKQIKKIDKIRDDAMEEWKDDFVGDNKKSQKNTQGRRSLDDIFSS